MSEERGMTALACVPGAIPPEERPAHAALVRRLFAGAVEARMEMADGYAFAFRSDAFASVARFIENERQCCPFLAFELTISPGEGPLRLRISGPPGTRELLAAELPI